MSFPHSRGLVKTVTGPMHTVENTWEADRDLLSAKENDWGMAPVSHYYYALNALGQRTAVEIDGLGTGSMVTWDWGYDAKGQVVKGDASSGSGATADDRFYDYDQIGNRKQSRTGTFTSTGGTPTDYYGNTAATTVGANGLNQYQAVKTGSVTRNPVHDGDGNLTDDGVAWDYVWDGENRMISATPKSTSGTRKILYRYDHLGRLSSRELQIWNGSAWAYHESYRYAYDGWNRIESCVNWMGLRDEYIWGLDLSGTPQGAGGVGGMLLWSTTYDSGANWKNYYPAYDGNGNVTELINGSGTVAAHWEYDPFGNILRSTAAGTWSDPVNLFEFRFSTKPQDRNTGLYYYGYRFYDPVTGRWPSKDPIEERGGINLYAMVGNNSITSVDFLGLEEEDSTIYKTVGKCEAYIYIGHSSLENPIKWDRTGCSIGGAVSCWPDANSPTDTRNQRDIDGDDKGTNRWPNPRWPMIPRHGDKLLGGDLGKVAAGHNSEISKQGEAAKGDTDSDDADNEHNFAKAVSRALSKKAENEIMKRLCKRCCKEVKFTYEIGEDKLGKDDIEKAVKHFGFKPGKTDSKTVKCP